MRVVAYTRVSTEEQNPESQLTEIERYCREKGYEIARVFEDRVSGAVDPFQRPGFAAMLEYVQRENITTIVMYDITRFYRAPSPVAAMQRLNDLMEKYHVIVEFVAEPMIEDPMLAELWRFMKSFIASYERRMIAMRTRYGLMRVKREGRLYHRPGILHYFAYVYAGLPRPSGDEGVFRRLGRDAVEAAARALVFMVEAALRRAGSWPAAVVELMRDPIVQTMYEYFPRASRSPEAWRRAYEAAKRMIGNAYVERLVAEKR